MMRSRSFRVCILAQEHLTKTLIQNSNCYKYVATSSLLQQRRHFNDKGDDTEQKTTLESIKSAGFASLETATFDLISKSRKPLYPSTSPTGSNTNKQMSENEVTIRQLQEANQIQEQLGLVLEQYSKKSPAFTLKGEAIDLTDVEISPCLRHVRVYWDLPYSMENESRKVRKAAMVRMQERLDVHGNRVLGRLLNPRLRRRYAPRLKFVPEDNFFMEELGIEFGTKFD